MTVSEAEQSVVDGVLSHEKRKQTAAAVVNALVPYQGEARDMSGIIEHIAALMKRCDDREDAAQEVRAELTRLQFRCRILEVYLGPETVKEITGQ